MTDNSKLKIENLFIFFCLLFGFILTSIIPLFHVDDEEAHFERIYAFSDGFFNVEKCSLPDGKTYPCSNIPVSILNMSYDKDYYSILLFDKQKIIPLEKEKKEYLMHMVPSYTIMSYLPQMAVLQVLKTLNLPPFYMMYILRILSLLIYTVIVYCAIRITPVKKHLFAFCGLVPMALYLAGGINTDGITISSCFLYTAYVFSLAYSEKVKTISKKNLLILTLLLLFITVLKFPYGILALLLFVIPKEKFPYSKNKIIAAEILILTVFSALITGFYLYNSKGVSSPVPIFISPREALVYFCQKPFNVITQYFITVKNYIAPWLIGSVAMFNSEKIIIPYYIVALYAVALFFNSFYQNKNEVTSKVNNIKNKIIYLIITAVFFTFTYFVNYLLFSDVNHNIVINFQGRYFIPLLPLICLLFAGNKTTDFNKLQNITILAYFVLMSAVFICLLNKFFVL